MGKTYKSGSKTGLSLIRGSTDLGRSGFHKDVELFFLKQVVPL